MTNKLYQKDQSIWETKDHIEAIETGLEICNSNKVTSPEQLLKLLYSLYSASELCLFNEFKRIFPYYINIIHKNNKLEPPSGYHNHACLMQHNLMSSVFQLYQGDGDCDDIKDALQLLLFWTERVPNQEKFNAFNFKLIKLARLILNEKKPPFFIISFKLPFSLPLSDGTYEIKTIARVKSISIKSFSATNLTSRIGDRHFCDVEIKVEGFTKTDNYWSGPNLANQYHESWNIQLALLVINRVILHAKLLNESLRLVLASTNDIGTARTIQYDGNDEEFHFSLALGFGGFALVDALSKQELNQEQVSVLAEKLITSELLLHEELYAQTLIERGDMNLIGAFYLLNSATEAMIDHFLFSLAIKIGRLELYEQFMIGNSYCFKCDIFKNQANIIEPPQAANPPSLFQKISLFKKMELMSSKQVRNMQNILSKIRNDKMRNEITHGRRNNISNVLVDNAISQFQELKESLNNLLDIN